MLFVCAFDPILVLAAVMGELLGDLVRSVWCSRAFISIRVELHNLPNAELVHSDHRCGLFLVRGPV